MSTTKPGMPPAPRRDLFVAFLCGGLVAAMIGLSFAAVPFYSWFCRTTGYGGTTQVATTRPTQMSDRTITVRFDSNVAAGLPWRFEPERRTIEVKLGEVVTVYYTRHQPGRPRHRRSGRLQCQSADGRHLLHKINCFCFTEQTMQPGEKRDMAVVFYVDPKLAEDSEQNNLDLITLSYTFYPVHVPDQAAAESARRRNPGVSEHDPEKWSPVFG